MPSLGFFGQFKAREERDDGKYILHAQVCAEMKSASIPGTAAMALGYFEPNFSKA
jgi:hypothetical protein